MDPIYSEFFRSEIFLLICFASFTIVLILLLFNRGEINDLPLSLKNSELDRDFKSIESHDTNECDKKPVVGKTINIDLIELIKKSLKSTNIDIDDVMTHSLLIASLTFDSFREVYLNLSETDENKDNIVNSFYIQSLKSRLRSNSHDELISLLKNIDIASNCAKSQLIELIISNPQALKRLEIQERRKDLSLMTNLQLKDLLRGVEKISRMKKNELIDKIIELEIISSNQQSE